VIIASSHRPNYETQDACHLLHTQHLAHSSAAAVDPSHAWAISHQHSALVDAITMCCTGINMCCTF
jgi:hypothetical protein